MELKPIARTLSEDSALTDCPECGDVIFLTQEYYGQIGFHPPWIGYFAIEKGVVIGTGAFKGAPREGKVEIAYNTFEAHRKKGFGTETCRLLVEKALQADPSIAITARTLPERNYSAILLEKNGFILMGTVQDEEDGEVWEWQYMRYPPLPGSEPLQLETDRLLLRPTRKEDADFIIDLLNAPTFLHFIGDRRVRTIADGEKYIDEKINGQLRRLGFSNYTIVRKSDGSRLGTCGLYARPGVPGIDLGYALLPQFEGKGYATEAARKMLDTAFRVFKIPVVRAYTTRENVGSQHVLEKLGLQHAGYDYLPDDPEKLLMYKLEKKDYNGRET